MKRVFRQWLAGLLSVVLVFTLLPAAALAEEADGATGQTAVEQVQALIDALPDADTITADNRADVQAQIDAIDAAMLELTGDEAAALDTARYDAAVAALLALDAPSALEQVQALIDALPEAESITADNRADVQAQIDAIDAAMLELTEDQAAALDTARYDAAAAALLALDAPSALEQVQALIDELLDAEEITDDNRADAQAQIDAIDAAMAELTEDQAAALDTTRYDAAAAALLALDAPSALEQVQALIDALPDADAITADNRADVEAQLTAIDEAKQDLTDDELDALDITRYMAAVEAILAQDDMAGANEPMPITTESNIKYLDWDEDQKKLVEKTYEGQATKVTSSTNKLEAGWYYVEGKVSLSSTLWSIPVSGEVHLILKDGCTLTTNCITVGTGNSLTIYGQSGQSGKLSATTPNDSKAYDYSTGTDYMYYAAIGGGCPAKIGDGAGNITINGGNVTAKGQWGAAIGSGREGSGGTITINGGTVTASGSNGIGGGYPAYKGSNVDKITINGGTITASNIKAGKTITINGGTVTVSTSGRDGIGDGNITINGGTITATSASGAGIGSFSTSANGNALIYASSVSDKSNQSNWSCILFEGNNGTVYGKQTLRPDFALKGGQSLTVCSSASLTIPGGATMTVPSGVTVTNNGTIYVGSRDSMNATLNNGGTITNEGTIDVWGKLTNGENGIENINSGKIVYHFNLDIEVPSFEEMTYGYSQPPAQAKIKIKSTGELAATITKVEIIGEDFVHNTGSIDGELTNGQSNENWTIGPVAGLSAGTHTATIKVTYTGSSGGVRTAEATVTFTVNKADPVVTDPKGKTLTYTGEEQELIEAGSTNGGEMQYSLDQHGVYSPDIPKGIEAKQYTVWYKVVGGDNFKDVEAKSVTATIDRGEADVTGNSVTVTYGDSVTLTVNVSLKASNGIMLTSAGQDQVEFHFPKGDAQTVAVVRSTGENGTASVTIQAKDVKNYFNPGKNTVTVNYGGSGNLNLKESVEISVTVNKRTLTYNVEATDRDYEKDNKEVTVALTPTNLVEGANDNVTLTAKGTVSSADANTYSSIELSEISMGGNDMGYYTVDSTATSTTSVTIKQKEVSLTWAGGADFRFNYDGQPHGPTVTVNTGIEGESLTAILSDATNINAGTYTAEAIGLESGTGNANNYKLPSNPTQTYTIAKAEVTFVVSGNNYTYDGTAKKVTLTNSNTSSAPELMETSGYTVSYGSDKAPSKTDVGEYDIYIKLTEAAAKNYKFEGKGDSETELTVTGEKLRITQATSTMSDVAITGADGKLTYGDTFTVSAKINAPNTMTGTVTFEAGDVELGKATSHDGGVWTITVGANEQVKQHAIFGSGENTKITAKYSGDKNIEASSGEKDGITVAKKPLMYTVTATGRVWNGGTGVNVTLAATNTVHGDNVTLTATGNLANEGKAGKYTKVNLSDVEIDGGDKDYYTTEPQKNDVDLTAEIQITKHDSSITPPAGKSGLTYTGEPLALIDAATAADGSTAKYYVGENAPADGAAEWQADVSAITGLNAGEYTVWYYADGDENHEDTSVARIKVTIAPATVSFTIGAENKDDWDAKGEANADPNPTGYTATGSGTDYKLSMIYDSYGHKANVIQTADEMVKIAAGTVNGFTVTYKKDGTEPDLTEITDAGTYDIIVNLTPAENTENVYNFQFNGQGLDVRSLKIGTVTVTPFTVHVTWSHLKYIYHAHPMHPTVKVQNAFNSDVQPITVPEDFDPEAGYEGKLLAYAVTNGSDVGDYEVTVTLYGTSAGNYTVEDTTGTVSILSAPVTFTVGDNIWDITKEPLPTQVTLRAAWGEVTTTPDVAVHHKYPGAGTKLDVGDLNTTIEYRKDGLTYTAPDNPPTEAGTYEVWVKIGNENYRHSATDSGDFHKVGELILTDNPASIKTYTITFDPNYDDAPNGPASMEKIFEKQTVIIPSASGVNEDGTEYDITRDSYRFLGWSYGGHTYKPNEEFHMPASDVTFKAEWVLAVDVSGTVKQGEDESTAKALPGATVTLKNGAEEVAETTTDNQGNFKLEQVAPGTYNLEVRYQSGSAEIVKTFLVEVGESGNLDGTYLLPTVALNTVVEVTPGITAAVDMGGIVSGEDIADVYTPDDRETVRDGGTVEFKMTIQNATLTTGQTEEIPVPEDRIGMVLDLELTKTVTKSGTGSTKTDIHDTKIPVTTVIHLPAELQGKSSYTVYRFHDMENEEDSETLEMQTITTSPNSDGEYLKIVRDGTAIEIHAEFYSTYVLTWQQSSGGGGISRYPVNLPSETDDGTITSNPTSAIPGSRVTLTVKPDEGYHIGFLTVTDRNGKPVELTDNGDGTYTFTQPYGQVTVKVEFVKCGSLDFTDLDTKAWYHDYTDYAIAHGLMQGTGGGLFDPDGIVNRAQMVMVLWNLRGKPVVNYYMTYSDVTEDTWYSEAVRWATSEGIAGGYGNGKFGPNDPITREQMTAMIYRYEQKYGEGGFTGDWMYRLPFKDLDQISDWAFEAVAWCNMKGVIKGKDDNLFDPKGLAKRSEMAAILTRFCKEAEK